MAIKFQYNKTSLGELGKQLKMRKTALPTIKSKESALRSEVKKAKDTARDYQRRLEALRAEYDYMVALWGEFDSTLLSIEDVVLATQKIAGVRTPALEDVRFEQKPYDLFSSPVPSLKYIAIYRGAPVSAITHYAKIKEITYSKEKKCNVCYFEGAPIKLPHDIVLGSKSGCFFRGAKYTSIESLLNATTADDIIFG